MAASALPWRFCRHLQLQFSRVRGVSDPDRPRLWTIAGVARRSRRSVAPVACFRTHRSLPVDTPLIQPTQSPRRTSRSLRAAQSSAAARCGSNAWFFPGSIRACSLMRVCAVAGICAQGDGVCGQLGQHCCCYDATKDDISCTAAPVTSPSQCCGDPAKDCKTSGGDEAPAWL